MDIWSRDEENINTLIQACFCNHHESEGRLAYCELVQSQAIHQLKPLPPPPKKKSIKTFFFVAG